MLSVNISGSERQKIKYKAVELFLKTAKARHPDEDFYSNLTKRIFEEALNKYAMHVNNPLFPQLHFLRKYSISNELSRMEFPNGLYIFTLKTSDSRQGEMLIKNYYLYPIDTDNLIIPDYCISKDKVLFPFTNYGVDHFSISIEIENDIKEYNSKMEEIYTSLDTQLKALLQVIDRCTTTKAFYAKLPNLTTLFPKSLQLKVNRKNDTNDIELTDEQKLMQDATNSIATASLLGD